MAQTLTLSSPKQAFDSLDTIFFFQAENLKENVLYQFQVRAMNMAGVSKASLASAALECKEWTLTVPGMKDDKRHLVDVKEERTI